MQRTLISCLLLIGCRSSEPAPQAPAELCIAENGPDHLVKLIPSPTGDPAATTTGPITNELAVSVREVRTTVPNREILVRDARGATVKMYSDGRNVESVHLDFDHYKTDKLCLYYRPAKDLTLTGGWKLDAAANAPRCHCWD